MEEIIEQYNLLTGENVEFLPVKEMFARLRERSDINPTDIVKFIETIFKSAEERVTEEGVTYDYNFIYTTGLVEKYQSKIDDLGDMMEDILIKAGKLKEIEMDFFNELESLDNQLFTMIKTKTKGDSGALLRTFICDGYKINPNGKVIGFNKESLLQGISDYNCEFNSAVQGRIPSIINANAVGDAGYISRKMEFLFSFLVLGDTNDCKAEYEIDLNEKTGSKYYGRRTGDGLIDATTPLGKYKIYSPLHCRSKQEGLHSVCEKCCGDLSKVWKNFDSLCTIYSTITEALTQSLLSSKHLIKINFQNYPGIEYLGNNEFKLPEEFDIEDGLLTREGSEIPFMKKDLAWKNDSKTRIATSSGEWWSLDTKSLLPFAKAVFNKTQQFKDIQLQEEYIDGFLELDRLASLNVQSVFYELIVMLMTREKQDKSILAKDSEREVEIISPVAAILGNGHYDSLFFQQMVQQLNTPEFHHKELKTKGGLFDIFLS